jgi:adenylyltransferase/sulfurtransferase
MTMTTDARFSRERLAGYDPAVLETSTVLLVGAGALAQNTLANLALPGVGELRVVDFDEFEPHNAARSPFYPSAPEARRWGLGKAEVVARKARALMLAREPVMRFAPAVVQALGLGAFSGVDVVLSGVDNPRARAYLSDACRLLGVPLIEAGFDGPAVSMSTFPATDDPDAPCYRCANPSLTGTFSCQRHANEARAAGVVPAIQPAAAVLGGLQAEAAIQALHGSHPTAFRRTTLNIRTGAAMQYELAASPTCAGVHRRLADAPAELEVGAQDALATLVAAVEAELGPGAEVELPEPFVVDAHCLACGTVMTVGAPEWAYDLRPRCRGCEGPWSPARTVPAEGYSPTKPARLTRDSEPSALAHACGAAGLPALAVFEATSADGARTAAFRLRGTLDDLFTTV